VKKINKNRPALRENRPALLCIFSCQIAPGPWHYTRNALITKIAFHVRESATGHGSTETNSPNSPSQSDIFTGYDKNDYHRRAWVSIFSGFVWRHPFHLKEPNPSA
jgi:hypothetical protein